MGVAGEGATGEGTAREIGKSRIQVTEQGKGFMEWEVETCIRYCGNMEQKA